MKTIIVIVFCLLLNTLTSSAKDFHLVARYVYDDSTTWTNRETVFILLLPDNQPVVFKTFDSNDMKRVISDGLPSGSGLYFDYDMNLTLGPNPLLKIPTETQMKRFIAFCKKKGITLKFSSGV
jgi:hypothetical protein